MPGEIQCKCQGCRYVFIFPEMPSLDPAGLEDSNLDLRTLTCHWCGPLIDGKATLLYRGSRTDGGSIPRVAWSMIYHPFEMPFLPFALAHDGEYAAELFSRSECDSRLSAGMRLADPIPGWKRATIYRAVRIGGGAPWKRHTPATIAEGRLYARTIDADEYNALKTYRDIAIIA